ncbi:hypothetical protein OAO87_00580 [bacterium]|nr:hypothetical protein [bacterium]
MATAMRRSASEAVADTHGLHAGRSAGPQRSVGSCSSGCRRWTEPTIWAKPTSSSQGLLFGGQVCLPSARATHAARHTCSDTHPLHATQRAAHLRPIFHLTEHASARVSRLCLECAERRRCTTFSSPTCEIDIAQPPVAMALVADIFYFVYERRARDLSRSRAPFWSTTPSAR